jgi:hypothetical protein
MPPRAILYSQSKGFSDYRVPKLLQVPEGVELKAFGYLRLWRHHDFGTGAQQVTAYDFRKPLASQFPRYLVAVEIGDNFRETIYCRSRADLMALYLAFTPTAAISQNLALIEGTFRRAFEAWHRHSPYVSCVVCDPGAILAKG